MPAEGRLGEPVQRLALTVPELARELALVRDPSQEASRRAFAAAAIAAGYILKEESAAASAAARMFGFDQYHAGARDWDGAASRSGTITYVDDERVEQYIGRQEWIAYGRAELADFRGEVGDQVRIVRRGTGVAVETIGPNRLQTGSPAAARETSSGMIVLRTTLITFEEVESCAQAVAARYGAVAHATVQEVSVAFGNGAARLVAISLEEDFCAEHPGSALVEAPLAAGVRLAVTVRSNALDAALDAERALMLFAALLSSEGGAFAIDDTGAIVSAEALYAFGARNEMRADAFAFVAAAAQRICPPQIAWFSDRAGVGDELTVFSSRPWSAHEATVFLARELRALGDAAHFYEDAVVPDGAELFSIEERGETGAAERLAVLRYETVDLEVAFLGVLALRDEIRVRVQARKDIDAIVGPIRSGIVIAFGNSGPDTESERFALEMRRAEALATALAASLARRGDALATDVLGTLYAVDDLVELSLRRCGKSTSWTARAASLTAQGWSPQVAM